MYLVLFGLICLALFSLILCMSFRFRKYTIPSAHPFLATDSQLESGLGKSHLILFTASSTGITLNISLPNIGNYFNNLTGNIYDATLANLFNNSLNIPNVISNFEPHITRISNNIVHHADSLTVFVPRGNHLLDYNVLNSVLAQFQANPAYGVIVLLPVLWCLAMVMEGITNGLKKLANFIIVRVPLTNSQRMFRLSITGIISKASAICSSTCSCSCKFVKNKFIDLKKTSVTSTLWAKNKVKDFMPSWMFTYDSSVRIPTNIIAYVGRVCNHSFKEIESPNAVLTWRCSRCTTGPLFKIWQCAYCLVKRCRGCVGKTD